MSGKLTTHVLDLSRGTPAAGMLVELFRVEPRDARKLLCHAITNADGRMDAPLLSGVEVERGHYELIFHAGAYFLGKDMLAEVELPFLNEIPIRFSIANPEQNYHVPLLVAPGGYSTYRGS
jgi:hydroxyisourate hydrolase